VSYLLEILAQGVSASLADILGGYFECPSMEPVDLLLRRTNENKDLPDPRFQLGLAHMQAGEPDRAIESLTEVCALHPDHLPAKLAIASAYGTLGRYDQAIEHLQIADRINPGDAAVRFCIGLCREKLHEPQLATVCYRDAIQADPKAAQPRRRLAAVAVLLGRFDQAVEQYRFLCRQDPQSNWTHSALAYLYYLAKQYDKSIEEFENAIALEPENWALADDEVEALVACGQSQRAIGRLEMLIDEQGAFPDLHVRLADLLGQTGDDEGALQHYRAALEIQEDYIEARVKLGTHHLLCKRWEQAAEAFCEACELNDRILENYIGMAVALTAAGQEEEAMNSLDLAVAIEPNSDLLFAETARLQLRASMATKFAGSVHRSATSVHKDDALDDDLVSKYVQAYASQTNRCGNQAALHYRYGMLLKWQGKIAAATEAFTRAVQISPAYTTAKIKLGIAQQESGHVEQAIETLGHSMDVPQNEIDMHYKLALLYTDRAQLEEALQLMERESGGSVSRVEIREAVALSFQNMGLANRTAATMRDLRKLSADA